MCRVVLTSVVLLTLVLGGRAAAQDDKLPPGLDRQSLKEAPGDDALLKLQKEQFNSALAEGRIRFQEFMTGRNVLGALLSVAQRLETADVNLQTSKAGRVAARQQSLELLRKLEAIQKARFEAGRVSVADLEQVRYARIGAEIRLLQAQRDAAPEKKK
jgi:hypothetical protein